MNRITMTLSASVLAASALLLAGCSTGGSAEVEYRVHTTGEQIGKLSYHTMQPGAGSVDFVDEVRKQSWSKRVDGGQSSSVQVTAPASGTTTCEIRSSGGEVLDRRAAKDGKSVECGIDR